MMSSARPLARETSHRPWDPAMTAVVLIAHLPAGRRRVDPGDRGDEHRATVVLWPAAQVADLPVPPGQPGRQPGPGQPGLGLRPATIAAVAAALASAQVMAATVAVCHGPSAGRPVRGSTMWCSSRPSRCQRRQVIDEVATAPPGSRTGCAGESPDASGRSAATMGQPSRGAVPPVAMSPPRLTSTPPACPAAAMTARAARSEPSPLAVAPRSSRTPGGSRSSAPSSRTRCQPGAGTAAASGSSRCAPMAAKSRS